MLPSGLNEDPIVIDDSDDTPTEENIPAFQYAPEEEKYVFEEIFADENGLLKFEEEINMVISHDSMAFHGRSYRGFRYKGIDWSTLVVINPSENKFGVFLGVDNPDTVPSHMQYKFKFQYDLYDSEGNWIKTGIYN